jgi:hypothetical protein
MTIHSGKGSTAMMALQRPCDEIDGGVAAAARSQLTVLRRHAVGPPHQPCARQSERVPVAEVLAYRAGPPALRLTHPMESASNPAILPATPDGSSPSVAVMTKQTKQARAVSTRSQATGAQATGASSTGATSVAFAAVIAAAAGAVAMGAVAIGALAIGRLRIGDAAVRRLRIDELEVDQLRVRRLQVLEPDDVGLSDV